MILFWRSCMALRMHHGPTDLCGNHFACFAMLYSSMVPGNLASQLEIWSTGQTYDQMGKLFFLITCEVHTW